MSHPTQQKGLNLASLYALLSLSPDSPKIPTTLASLIPDRGLDKEIKSYPGASYHNYYALGISLCFESRGGEALSLTSVDIYNPTATTPSPSSPPSTSSSGPASTGLGTGGKSRSKPNPYTAPPFPLELHFRDREIVLPPRKAGEQELRLPRPETLALDSASVGRDVVRCLGEPSRKGSGQWVGVWLEWGEVVLLTAPRGSEAVEIGLMLELSDPKGAEKLSEEQKKRGAGGVWDRAAGWRWGSVKIFKAEPSS